MNPSVVHLVSSNASGEKSLCGRYLGRGYSDPKSTQVSSNVTCRHCLKSLDVRSRGSSEGIIEEGSSVLSVSKEELEKLPFAQEIGGGLWVAIDTQRASLVVMVYHEELEEVRGVSYLDQPALLLLRQWLEMASNFISKRLEASNRDA